MKKNILVVDDSALMRRVECDIINSDSNFQATDVCRDGLEAYEKLKTTTYDGVVLDINMPRMDGLQLLEKLQNDGIKANVIMVSTLTSKDAEVTILAMERGIFSDMTKSRLDELEVQLSLIKEQILHEDAQTKVSLSKEDIVAYIKSALKKEAKRLINLLVEKIILYENKIEIFYKYQKTKSPDDISQGFLFYQNTVFYNKTRIVKNQCIKKTIFTEEKYEIFHNF